MSALLRSSLELTCSFLSGIFLEEALKTREHQDGKGNTVRMVDSALYYLNKVKL